MTTPPDPTNLPSAEHAAASSPAAVQPTPQREPSTREWWERRIMIGLVGVAVGAACPYLPWPVATSVCSAVAAFVRGATLPGGP